MKIISMVLLVLLFAGSEVLAQDLRGTMRDNGDGVYILSVKDASGMRYTGEAEDYGDGKLHVVLEDQREHSHIGTASPLGDEQFSLEVEDEITEVESSGIVRLVGNHHWFY